MNKLTQAYQIGALLDRAICGFEFEFYTNYSFTKLMEIVNWELAPIKVHGLRKYHSNFVPDAQNFKIEPDLSGGENMIELVTGPIPYRQARIELAKILGFLNKHAFTNEQCSLHINISFDGEDGKLIKDINPLKMIMGLDEDEVYKIFPSRKGNVYAKSIRKILPGDGLQWINDQNVLRANLRLPDFKYYGVNFSTVQKGRLEIRYIGGRDFHKKTNEILYLLDRFISNAHDSINNPLTPSEMDRLRIYLESNWKRFRSFHTLDLFKANYPQISLEVDRNDSEEILRFYYPQMSKRIYELIAGSEGERSFKLNWDTTSHKLEVIGASLSFLFDVKETDFINSEVSGLIAQSCNFINCKIENCDLMFGKIWDSRCIKTRLYSMYCNYNTQIMGGFFADGFMGGTMEGGIFRSGKISQTSFISSFTKKIIEPKMLKPRKDKPQWGSTSDIVPLDQSGSLNPLSNLDNEIEPDAALN